MKHLSDLELNELCAFCGAIEKICKKDFVHISHIDAVKKILQLTDLTYEKADNVLTARENKLYSN